MMQLMYDIPSDETIVQVGITPECVTEGAEPHIIRDPERTARPRLGSTALQAQDGGLAPHTETV